MRRFLFPAFAFLFAALVTLSTCELILRIWPPPWLQLKMASLLWAQSDDLETDKKNGAFWRFVPGRAFNVAYYEFRMTANIDEFGGRRTVCSGCEIDASLPPVVISRRLGYLRDRGS